MLNIKLSIPGFGSNINISQFVGNLENRYHNCKFYVNNSDISEVDFWFVIDDLQFKKESVLVVPDHIYFLFLSKRLNFKESITFKVLFS